MSAVLKYRYTKTTKKTNMDKINNCCLCLAHDDLLRITKEKERLINSVLQRELSKDNRICINCSSLLSYLDKFQKTSQTAHNIQKASFQHQNNLFDMPSATQDKVSDAFDVVLNWLTGVNVILEHHSITTDPEVSSNPVPDHGSAGTLIISSVHGKEFVTEEFLPDNSVDDEAENDKMESSSDESEEPMIDDEHINEKIIQEIDDDDISKYFDTTKKGKNRCYKCPDCSKFFSRPEFKYHFNVHKGIKPFKCHKEGCSKAFSSPYAAQQHCRETHKLYVRASKCTPEESNSELLEEPNDDELDEYLTKINGKSHFKCPKCKKTFMYRFKLKYHLNSHNGIKPYKCIVEGCSKAYISPYKAQEHCKQTHSLKVSASKWTTKESNSRESENDIIPEILLTEQTIQNPDDGDLTKYIDNTKKGVSKRCYKCPVCSKYYARPELKYHFNVHKGIKPFKCLDEECSKAFTSPYEAQHHCRDVHKLYVRASKWTRKESNSEILEELNDDELDKYLTKINGIILYECPNCKKSYNVRNRLKYHLNSHNGIKPYKCIVEGCSKAYMSPYKAQEHCKQTHSLKVSASKWTAKQSKSIEFEDEKIQEIPLTEQTIKENDEDDLVKYRRITKEENRFKCPDCKNSFPAHKHLKYHMNKHKGITPFKCIVQGCSKAYISPYMAAKHCKFSHKISVSVSRWTGIDERKIKKRKT